MRKLSFDAEKLLDTYKAPFSMKYGSGSDACKQAGYAEDANPMVDLVFGTENTQAWHEVLMHTNPQDYSLIARMLGIKGIEWLQPKGACIYYHPYVDFEGHEIKYGIISLEDLKKDLTEWITLYCAGRLHKPVEILRATTDVRWAIQENLSHALSAALLILPKHFTPQELFMTIAGLSYTGDTRMKHGENPDKVKNIVLKNENAFAELYKDVIARRWDILQCVDGDRFEQNKSPEKQAMIFSQLPRNLRKKTEFIENPNAIAENIQIAIADIVRGPSLSQSLKGVISAGPIKSWRYLKEKRAKAKAA